MDQFNLSGRTAVVTGGNRGIGFGIARGLARAGANIAIIGRDREKGALAQRALTADGANAIFLTADITNENACESAVEIASREFGSLHILVNNAGIALRKLPEDYSFDEWGKVLNSNLSSAFLMSRTIHPHFCAVHGGKIINIASILAIFGAPFSVAYSASKGGLVQFTKALATAWAKDNIQVNAILPGWIDTELTVSAREEVPGLNDLVLTRTPSKRWGQTKDLEGAAIFFASSASDFVTGTALPVDGGYSVQV